MIGNVVSRPLASIESAEREIAGRSQLGQYMRLTFEP
jgi:hypothetical protein